MYQNNIYKTIENDFPGQAMYINKNELNDLWTD